MSHPSLKEQLLERLQCPICLEQYDLQARLPRLLHGGHTLCFQCIKSLHPAAAAAAASSPSSSASSSSSSTVICPLCHHKTVQPPDGYPINFTLVDALEVIHSSSSSGPRCDLCHEDEETKGEEDDEQSAVARCLTCNQWLCALHHKSHTKSKDTKSHTLKGVTAIKEDPSLYREVPKCDKHPQHPLDLFCSDCDAPICSRCALFAPHQNHRREEIQSAFATFHDVMKPALVDAQRVADACEQGAQQVEEAVVATQRRQVVEEKRARAYFAQLQALLTQREEAVCQELRSATEEIVKALAFQANSLRLDLAFASSTCEVTQRMLEQDGDVRVLQRKRQMQQQVQQVAAQFDPLQTVPCRRAEFRFREQEGLAERIAAAGVVVQEKEQQKVPKQDHQIAAQIKAPVADFSGSAEVFVALPAEQQVRLTTVRITPSSQSMFGNWLDVLVEAIKQSSSMTTVNLSYNKIGDAGATALADAIKQSRSMTTVYLHGNSIGDAGAIALADAIKQSSTMTTVNLGGNSIGDAGATALADAIKQSSTMTTVRLYGNIIGDAGTTALADAIKQSSTMTSVGLYGNNIGDAGAIALADAIKQSSTMTTVDLNNNSIGAAGATALAAAIKQSSTMTEVYLGDNNIGAAARTALAEAIKQSRLNAASKRA